MRALFAGRRRSRTRAAAVGQVPGVVRRPGFPITRSSDGELPKSLWPDARVSQHLCFPSTHHFRSRPCRRSGAGRAREVVGLEGAALVLEGVPASTSSERRAQPSGVCRKVSAAVARGGGRAGLDEERGVALDLVAEAVWSVRRRGGGRRAGGRRRSGPAPPWRAGRGPRGRARRAPRARQTGGA
jgi:hypothetical protein